MKIKILLLSALLLYSPEVRAESFSTEEYRVELETVASNLVHPWGVAFLPDGSFLVTERPGRLRIVRQSGQVTPPIRGVPNVRAEGQGGLLDVALDPDFPTNSTIYLSYAEPGEGGAGTAVARAVLQGESLEEVEVIFRQQPKVGGSNHWGSRLVFNDDKTLFVTLGDRYSYRDKAQELSNHLGKVVRINRDGSVPKDNPFIGKENALAEIWSYGHRNVQGATLHPTTRQLWTHEHGAKGGDELNITRKGLNYGWPIITWGVDYSGAKIGEGTIKEGMEQPLHYWTPSIAPSGMTFYTGERFPKWRNSLFMGSLSFAYLNRVVLKDDKVLHQEKLFASIGERMRDVRQGPDGFLYLLTDSGKGRLLRIKPTSSARSGD